MTFMHHRCDRRQVGTGPGVAFDGLDRRGQDAVGIAGRESDADRAHIDAEPDPCAHALPRPAVTRSPTACSTLARASPTLVASTPPPWATSSLPPPPPPRACAATLTSSPALRPQALAASLVAMMTRGRSLATPATATTDGRSLPSLDLTSSARLRRSSAPTPWPAS